MLALMVLASGAAPAAAQSGLQMTVDDPAPVTEGTGTNTSLVFTLSLSGPAPQGGVTVDFTTSDETAKAPGDYTIKSGSVTIPERENVGQVSITVIGDAIDEPDEKVRLALSNVRPNIQVQLTKPVGLATIADDDDPPKVSVADATVQGGSVSTGTNRLVVFDVKLSAQSGKTVQVDYTTEDGTAVACVKTSCTTPSDGDYVPISGTLTFNPGVTGLQLSVVAIGDSLDVNKEFKLRLLNRSHLQSPTAVWNAGDVGRSITVGSAARTIASVAGTDGRNITLDQPTDNGNGVVFSYTPVYDDGVVTGGTDLQSGQATFTQGDKDKAITVGGVANGIADVVNTHEVTLKTATTNGTGVTLSYLRTFNDGLVSGGQNQTIEDGLAIGSVPSAGPAIKIGAAQVTEGPAGATTPVTLTVSLDNASPQEVSVGFASADGSAKAGQDYTGLPAGQRLTFAPGEKSKDITLAVLGNDVDESDRAFTVTLKDPVNGTLASANASGLVTVKDDDGTPALEIPDVSVAEPRGATGSVDVTFRLTAPSQRKLTTEYRTENETAIAGVQYQKSEGGLTFEAGETSKTVTIPVAGDGKVSEDPTFLVIARNTADSGGESRGRVRLIDGDLTAESTPAVSINDVSVRDGGTGLGDAVFTVRLDRTLPRRVSVDYASADVTARAGRDYDAVSGTLTIPAGERSVELRVPLRAVAKAAANRSFKVTLSNPVSAKLGRATGTAVIIDAASATLPGRVDARKVALRRLLCTTAEECTGVLARWTAPRAGTVDVAVLATLPAAKKGGKVRSVTLVRTRVAVVRGAGRVRVARAPSRATARLAAQLRRGKVGAVRVRVSFTDRLGARRTFSAPVGLT